MGCWDARQEDLDTHMPPAWQKIELAEKGMYQGMLVVPRVGMLKTLGMVMGSKADPPIVEKLPPELREMYLAIGFQPKYFQANLDELSAVAESDQQVRDTGSLGSLPLTVIRHGLPEMFATMSPDKSVKAEEVWQGLQTDLAGLSTKSRVLEASNCGHRIQMDQPEIMVEAIREMVENLRNI